MINSNATTTTTAAATTTTTNTNNDNIIAADLKRGPVGEQVVGLILHMGI